MRKDSLTTALRYESLATLEKVMEASSVKEPLISLANLASALVFVASKYVAPVSAVAVVSEPAMVRTKALLSSSSLVKAFLITKVSMSIKSNTTETVLDL
jgi:hypothetical protein